MALLSEAQASRADRLAWAHAHLEGARRRYWQARSAQLRAIGRQWQVRRRLFDRLGPVVAMLQEGDDVLNLQLGDGTDDDLALVFAKGEVDISSSPYLEACLRGLVDARRGIVLDLADVTFFDASGVRVLLTTLRLAEFAGVSFRLRSPSRPVARVLNLTSVDGLIPIDEPEGA